MKFVKQLFVNFGAVRSVVLISCLSKFLLPFFTFIALLVLA